ncbi:MAG: NAD-dependent epimerase/dehydratase family protein [Candidatus Omnitrophica bacterium]|nr:NAD-dependent epimerase/dehydratase family protein [Candidatus Omnitrophota bacterium]
MKRAVVIGGAGFIGSQLADRLLRSGYKVTVFDNLTMGKKSHLRGALTSSQFRFVKGDVLDERALGPILKGDPTVFHLAANSDIMKAMGNPGLDFHQGIRATFYVLEAMRRSGTRKIVYFSGSGVYGDCGRKYMRENQGALCPQSMYGAAKLSSEAMISAYSFLYGMQAWVLRLANIIGPRPTHGVVFDLIKKLKTDSCRLRVLGNGRQSKSYLHVEDLLSALFLVMKRAREPLNVFNISSGSYLSVRDITLMVIKSMGLEGKTKVVYSRSERGWKGDVPHYRLDITKIQKLGWRPQMTSKQAVLRTIREVLEDSEIRPR